MKNKIKGVKIRPAKYAEQEECDKEEIITGDKVVLAVGRKGANWLVKMCDKHNIKYKTLRDGEVIVQQIEKEVEKLRLENPDSTYEELR